MRNRSIFVLVEEHDRGRYTDRLAETAHRVVGAWRRTAHHIERYVEQGPLLVLEAGKRHTERRGQLSTGGGQCRWTDRLHAIGCIAISVLS